jgi:hypothetical protein
LPKGKALHDLRNHIFLNLKREKETILAEFDHNWIKEDQNAREMSKRPQWQKDCRKNNWAIAKWTEIAMRGKYTTSPANKGKQNQAYINRIS